MTYLLPVGNYRGSKNGGKHSMRGFVCVKYNTVLHYAVSKSNFKFQNSNFAREECRQRLRLKRRGVSPTPPYGGLLVNFYSKTLYNN